MGSKYVLRDSGGGVVADEAAEAAEEIDWAEPAAWSAKEEWAGEGFGEDGEGAAFGGGLPVAGEAGSAALGVAVGLFEACSVDVGQVLGVGDLDVWAVDHACGLGLAALETTDQVDTFVSGEDAPGAELRIEAVDGEKEVSGEIEGVLGDHAADGLVVDGDWMVVAEDS